MAQVTIYLDPDTELRMKAYAKGKDISLSQWIAGLIREKLQSEWPVHVAALAGAWNDLPSLEEIRDDMSPDIARESL